MELKKELQERPTQKLVDDLKKKVQILQVLQQKKILFTATGTVLTFFGTTSPPWC
jgi:hypothetical protein